MSANEPTKRNEGFSSPAPTETGFGLPKGLKKSEPSVVHSKWEKHRKRLLVLRSHLEAERRNHALAIKEPLEKFSMSMADAATDEFDHDLALSQLSAEQAALYEVDEALARIDNGTYGICEITGNPIPESRLNALPWTRFGTDAERRLEQRGETHRMQLGSLHSVTGRNCGKLGDANKDEETPEALPNDESLFPQKYLNRPPQE